MSIRVLVADDHQAVRAGISAMLLGSECEVAAQAVDADQAVRYTLTCNPDVVLLDLRMSGGDSLEAIEEIKTKRPQTRVLVFTVSESVPAMVRAHSAGADGYLFKDAARDKLLEAIRRVASGKRGWSRRQLRQIGTGKHCSYDTGIFTGLTERESQVLARIVHGMTNEEIAEDLEIDQETVKQHVKRLLRKLGVEDRTQAALWGLRQESGPHFSSTPSGEHG